MRSRTAEVRQQADIIAARPLQCHGEVRQLVKRLCDVNALRFMKDLAWTPSRFLEAAKWASERVAEDLSHQLRLRPALLRFVRAS